MLPNNSYYPSLWEPLSFCFLLSLFVLLFVRFCNENLILFCSFVTLTIGSSAFAFSMIILILILVFFTNLQSLLYILFIFNRTLQSIFWGIKQHQLRNHRLMSFHCLTPVLIHLHKLRSYRQRSWNQPQQRLKICYKG